MPKVNNKRRSKIKIIIFIVLGILGAIGTFYVFINLLAVFIFGSAMVSALKNANKPLSTTVSHPCQGKPAAEIGLGSANELPAQFTTAGGEIFITKRFEHGDLDPERGITRMNIGPVSHIPTYDKRSGSISVSKDATELYVDEMRYGRVTLPPGRYWLWSSNGGDVRVVSCEANGVSDPSSSWEEYSNNISTTEAPANPSSCSDCPAGYNFCQNTITKQTSCINSAILAPHPPNVTCSFCPNPTASVLPTCTPRPSCLDNPYSQCNPQEPPGGWCPKKS